MSDCFTKLFTNVGYPKGGISERGHNVEMNWLYRVRARAKLDSGRIAAYSHGKHAVNVDTSRIHTPFHTLNGNRDVWYGVDTVATAAWQGIVSDNLPNEFKPKLSPSRLLHNMDGVAFRLGQIYAYCCAGDEFAQPLGVSLYTISGRRQNLDPIEATPFEKELGIFGADSAVTIFNDSTSLNLLAIFVIIACCNWAGASVRINGVTWDAQGRISVPHMIDQARLKSGILDAIVWVLWSSVENDRGAQAFTSFMAGQMDINSVVGEADESGIMRAIWRKWPINIPFGVVIGRAPECQIKFPAIVADRAYGVSSFNTGSQRSCLIAASLHTLCDEGYKDVFDRWHPTEVLGPKVDRDDDGVVIYNDDVRRQCAAIIAAAADTISGNFRNVIMELCSIFGIATSNTDLAAVTDVFADACMEVIDLRHMATGNAAIFLFHWVEPAAIWLDVKTRPSQNKMFILDRAWQQLDMVGKVQQARTVGNTTIATSQWTCARETGLYYLQGMPFNVDDGLARIPIIGAAVTGSIVPGQSLTGRSGNTTDGITGMSLDDMFWRRGDVPIPHPGEANCIDEMYINFLLTIETRVDPHTGCISELRGTWAAEEVKSVKVEVMVEGLHGANYSDKRDACRAYEPTAADRRAGAAAARLTNTMYDDPQAALEDLAARKVVERQAEYLDQLRAADLSIARIRDTPQYGIDLNMGAYFSSRGPAFKMSADKALKTTAMATTPEASATAVSKRTTLVDGRIVRVSDFASSQDSKQILQRAETAKAAIPEDGPHVNHSVKRKMQVDPSTFIPRDSRSAVYLSKQGEIRTKMSPTVDAKATKSLTVANLAYKLPKGSLAFGHRGTHGNMPIDPDNQLPWHIQINAKPQDDICVTEEVRDFVYSYMRGGVDISKMSDLAQKNVRSLAAAGAGLWANFAGLPPETSKELQRYTGLYATDPREITAALNRLEEDKIPMGHADSAVAAAKIKATLKAAASVRPEYVKEEARMKGLQALEVQPWPEEVSGGGEANVFDKDGETILAHDSPDKTYPPEFHELLEKAGMPPLTTSLLTDGFKEAAGMEKFQQKLAVEEGSDAPPDEIPDEQTSQLPGYPTRAGAQGASGPVDGGDEE